MTDSLLADILHIVISLYVFMLAMRMFISSRDAYFNPIFSGIYRATEPIMKPVYQAIRKGLRDTDKADFAPLIPIIFLVILDGLVLAMFTWIGLVQGITLRVQGLFEYAFLIFIVLILIFSVFYRLVRYPANPFLRAAFRVMEPAYVNVGRLGTFFKEYSGATLFAVGLIVYFLLNTLILQMMGLGTIDGYVWQSWVAMQQEAIRSLATLLRLPVFFSYLIIIGALMSWLTPDPNNPIVQLIRLLTEPINRPFRKIVPLIGGIDISPIFSILALQFIAQLGYRLIRHLS